MASKSGPIIRFETGAAKDAVVVRHKNGLTETVRGLDDLTADTGIAEIRVLRTARGPFGPCELIETPPLRDGHVTEEQIALIASCDILVWVTIGSQAWRLSEKSILDEIGDQRPSEAVLVVSRADKFRSEEDREKLVDRIERETDQYFSARVLMGAAPAAIEASAQSSGKTAWIETGAQALAAALDEAVQACEFIAEEEALDDEEDDFADTVVPFLIDEDSEEFRASLAAETAPERPQNRPPSLSLSLSLSLRPNPSRNRWQSGSLHPSPSRRCSPNRWIQPPRKKSSRPMWTRSTASARSAPPNSGTPTRSTSSQAPTRPPRRSAPSAVSPPRPCSASLTTPAPQRAQRPRM